MIIRKTEKENTACSPFSLVVHCQMTAKIYGLMQRLNFQSSIGFVAKIVSIIKLRELSSIELIFSLAFELIQLLSFVVFILFRIYENHSNLRVTLALFSAVHLFSQIRFNTSEILMNFNLPRYCFTRIRVVLRYSVTHTKQKYKPKFFLLPDVQDIHLGNLY